MQKLKKIITNEKFRTIFISLFIVSIICNTIFIGKYYSSKKSYTQIIQQRDKYKSLYKQNTILVEQQKQSLDSQRQTIEKLQNSIDVRERTLKKFELNESKINNIDNEIGAGIEGVRKSSDENIEILREIIKATDN